MTDPLSPEDDEGASDWSFDWTYCGWDECPYCNEAEEVDDDD